ncbi:MAG TPA: hypothetical protein VKB65_05645, partial [Myxococcota bacterium]|nr:hypothetical protein [Myxococcota bacterium]
VRVPIDGRGVRISAGVDGDTNWVSVQVSDPNSGELRRYEYENGSLVQTETTKPSGNKVVQKTDPATGQTQTTTICVADDCTDTRVNPDAVPRGTPPPAAADDDGPEPPTRLDTLVQWGPDGGLPDIQIDPESVPDPDGQLINPTRDGSPPRGEGVAGEGDPSAVRNDPLIQWVPGNEPHDDPPPASPASSSGTKGPAGGRDRGGDDGGKASAKGGKQGKSEARRERPNRGAPGR